MRNLPGHTTVAVIVGEKTRMLAPGLVLVWLAVHCYGQGTMTFTFDGQPPGTIRGYSLYTESGMNFWNPYGPQSVFLVGTGVSGFPDDGTAHLGVPAGGDLAFTLNSVAYFGLASFDAAGETISSPGATLQLVGYTGQGITVTNYFTVDSLAARRASSLPDFQTFHPDSQFQHVYRVDVLTYSWSLDNVVISGVPEPSTGALVVLGTLSALGWARVRRRRPSQGC